MEVDPRGRCHFDGAFICVYGFLVYEIDVVKDEVDRVSIIDALGNDVLTRAIYMY